MEPPVPFMTGVNGLTVGLATAPPSLPVAAGLLALKNSIHARITGASVGVNAGPSCVPFI